MRLRDEQGMLAIGVALMLIVVLALFGGVLWQYSMAEMKRVEKTEQDMQALFLARAGAEAVMAAWREEPSNEKPSGAMDRIYYDLDLGIFTTQKPRAYLGHVDVVVTKQEGEDGREYETVITATAVVGNVTRLVKLISYPHRFGHDSSLQWYQEQTGEISNSKYAITEELVMMRTYPQDKPIHISANTNFPPLSPREITFQASKIVFSSPVNLGLNGSNLYDSPSGVVRLHLAAEMIFFQGLEIMYLPEYSLKWFGELITRPSKRYTVVLRLPVIEGEIKGKSGRDIKREDPFANVEADAMYGEVYFDESAVSYQEYQWIRRGLIFGSYSVEPSGGAKPLRIGTKSLSGEAFYFKDGTPLNSDSIDAGDLVWIRPENRIKREELEGIQPFFWE